MPVWLTLFQAEKILTLAEMNLRLETEKEKIQPYYTNQPISEANDSEKGKMNSHQTTVLTDAGTPIDKFNLLDKFYQKFNKILLDKMALEAERSSLQTENQDLRVILKVGSHLTLLI